MVLARVVLSSGRDIELTDVHLSSTYSGLIEGYPMARMNDAMLSGLPDRARYLFPHAPVHIAQPPRIRPESDPREIGPFGPIELLPSVTCIGQFRSHPVDPDLDPVLHRSALVIAWYQQDATLPTLEGAPSALRIAPWDDVAEDHEL